MSSALRSLSSLELKHCSEHHRQSLEHIVRHTTYALWIRSFRVLSRTSQVNPNRLHSNEQVDVLTEVLNDGRPMSFVPQLGSCSRHPIATNLLVEHLHQPNQFSFCLLPTPYVNIVANDPRCFALSAARDLRTPALCLTPPIWSASPDLNASCAQQSHCRKFSEKRDFQPWTSPTYCELHRSCSVSVLRHSVSCGACS